VIWGTFKQTLIGHGGGVASPDHPIKLYVRHEQPGQVFSLDERQQHETSSTAGCLLLAAMPAPAREELDSATGDESRAEDAIRRLQRMAVAALPRNES
jgi:hypothetical protein